MKKLFTVGLTFLLTFSLAACARNDAASDENISSENEDNSSSSSSDDVIKIGMYMPLTGDSSTLGQNCYNAAQLAVEQINEEGGLLGKQFELICYDDQSSTEQAVKNVSRLIDEDHVDAIIGSLHSGNIKATGDIIEKAGIVEIGTGIAVDWLQQGWTYLFRSLANTECSNTSLIEYCIDNDLTEIAIFNSQDEYGTDTAEVFETVCQDYPIEVVAHETFNPGDSDFTGQMSKINSMEPDAVFISAVQNDLGSIIKQLRLAGYEGYILGDIAMGNAEVIDIAQDATNGCIFSAQYVIPDKPENAENEMLVDFYESYVEMFNEMPTSDCALRTYDACLILFEGIRNAESVDGEALKKGITEISGKEFLGGTFDFTDGTGEGIHTQRLYIINDGEIELLQG
ncbi:MAG: ABC transporter substrate-binding protein [Ruminococcus sp.]|jgi:branched-chain amino acid transport system substrate-binding protein